MLLGPEVVNELELLLIGAGAPLALVMLAPSVIELPELLGGVSPVLYPPDTLPLPPFPKELEAVLEPIEDVPPSELPATLS